MIIYLKSGQTIDMGDVTEITDDNNQLYKPWRHCKEDDSIIDLAYNCGGAITYLFRNSNNEILEVKESEIVGIREDVE